MKLFEIRKESGGHTKGYICGKRIFSFRRRNIFDFNLQVGREQMAAYNEIFGDGWKPEKKPGMVGAVFILTSRYVNLLKAAFDQPNIYFHVLEIPYEYFSIPVVKELLLKNRNRIGKVFDNCPRSYDAFFKVNESTYDLSFDEIRQYVASHYKAQRMFMRHVYDMPEADYRFIHSLRFWLGVFCENDIRLVFSDRVEHGDCGDALVYEIAVRHHVPVYQVAVEIMNLRNLVLAFRRIDETGYHDCSLRDVLPSSDLEVDLRQFVHAPDAANRKDLTERKTADASVRKTGHCLLRALRRFEKAYARLSIRDQFKVDTAYFSSWGTRHPRQTYRDWQQVCELKKTYMAISERPRLGDKYIFYALHLEPEANINNRGLISNQLWVIKSLAEALPDGYKLYVKEHPMQFSLADWAHGRFFHMSHNMEWFRSKQFYAEILRIPNVHLIAVDTDSSGLIAHAQAVATICGTVALEAVVQRKPLLVFSDETCVVSRVRDVFRVHSMGEVKEALRRVASGFVPDYSDIEQVASGSLIKISNYNGLEIDNEQCRKFDRLIKWAIDNACQLDLYNGRCSKDGRLEKDSAI